MKKDDSKWGCVGRLTNWIDGTHSPLLVWDTRIGAVSVKVDLGCRRLRARADSLFQTLDSADVHEYNTKPVVFGSNPFSSADFKDVVQEQSFSNPGVADVLLSSDHQTNKGDSAAACFP